MALGDCPYATLDEFKERINVTGTDDDTMLQQILNSAGMVVDALTRQPPRDKWAFKDYAGEVRTFDDDRSGVIIIDDCISVTSIGREGETMTETDDYKLEPANATPKTRIVFRATGWPYDPRSSWDAAQGVEVTGTWGYCAAADLPAAITEATLTQAEKLYERVGVSPEVLTQAIGDPWRTADKVVVAMLAPFQRRNGR